MILAIFMIASSLQIRILSYDKTAAQLRLDMFVAAGAAGQGLALGRSALRYDGTAAHYDFDDAVWVGGGLLQYPTSAGNPPLTLGDGAQNLAPLKLPSSAPLFGGYQVRICSRAQAHRHRQESKKGMGIRWYASRQTVHPWI